MIAPEDMRYVGLWVWADWGETVERPAAVNGADELCRACAALVFGIAVVRAYNGLGRFPAGWKPISRYEAVESAIERAYEYADREACGQGAKCKITSEGRCECCDNFCCQHCGKDMAARDPAAA